MRFWCIAVVLLLGSQGFGQEQWCPNYSDKAGLLQFLLDHRSNSLEADPQCVERAFASLSHDKKYIDDLIGLLDFERNFKNDEKLISRSNEYPAIGALGHPEAVPRLVKAIEKDESQVARINAAEAISLALPDEVCTRGMIALLEREAASPEVSAEEQTRLKEAEKYAFDHLLPRPCKNERSNR